MLIRIFLALTALMFLAFGIVSMLDPVTSSAGYGVDIGGPNGAYEARGIYGGVSLGAALLCGLSVWRDELLRPALWFLMAYFGGYIFARLTALALGPAPTPVFYPFIAFEAVMLLLSAVSLQALRGKPG